MSDDEKRWQRPRRLPDGTDSIYKRPLTHTKRHPTSVGFPKFMWALTVVVEYMKARRLQCRGCYPPEPLDCEERGQGGGFNLRRRGRG